MIRLILMGFGLIGAQFAHASQTVGNGGYVTICIDMDGNETTHLLDFHEVYNQTQDIGDDSLSLREKVDYLLAKLRSKDAWLADRYQQRVDKVFSSMVERDDLPVIDDLGHVYIRPLCRAELVMVQVHAMGDVFFPYRRDLFERLSVNDQAGLILHEIIYGDAFERGHTDSSYSRAFVRLIARTEFENMHIDAYQRFLFRNRFNLPHEHFILPDTTPNFYSFVGIGQYGFIATWGEERLVNLETGELVFEVSPQDPGLISGIFAGPNMILKISDHTVDRQSVVDGSVTRILELDPATDGDIVSHHSGSTFLYLNTVLGDRSRIIKLSYDGNIKTTLIDELHKRFSPIGSTSDDLLLSFSDSTQSLVAVPKSGGNLRTITDGGFYVANRIPNSDGNILIGSGPFGKRVLALEGSTIENEWSVESGNYSPIYASTNGLVYFRNFQRLDLRAHKPEFIRTNVRTGHNERLYHYYNNSLYGVKTDDANDRIVILKQRVLDVFAE